MSYLDEAIDQLDRRAGERVHAAMPFVATVVALNGNLTIIQRPGADTADAELYPKSTADTFVVGDRVLCQRVVTGKLVITGKVRG